MQERNTKHKDETAYAIKTYIESNLDGMFTNESDIAEFVQLYTEVNRRHLLYYFIGESGK